MGDRIGSEEVSLWYIDMVKGLGMWYNNMVCRK